MNNLRRFLFLMIVTLLDCTAADCPPITVPAGASTLPGCSTRTNRVCSIQCSATKVILSQICQSNGVWSGPVINCESTLIQSGGFNGFPGLQTCNSLQAPRSGSYSGSCAPGFVGGSCVFSCSTGFTIRGNATLTCLSTGTWSSNAPTCVTRTTTRWYILVRRWFG